MTSCICNPVEAPYDHLIHVNRECIEHGPGPILFDLDAAAARVDSVSKSPMAVFSLVKAGWTREGAGWTHPTKTQHLTQAKAYATLLWEEGNLA